MAHAPDPVVRTGPDVEDPGPLTRRVLDYEATMKRVVAAPGPPDWAPLTAFVAVDEFQRVGTFLEVQDWPQYTDMLTRWASATDTFDTTVRRIAELARLVYFEIEERHVRGDDVTVVSSLTVFEFDEDDKIRRLNVYLQQPR